ncbi:MAG TPA: hypothetical protein VFJ62_06270 [Usitatibacter sp.]|nr:hypothetical protein [Usitatibacter sp.]
MKIAITRLALALAVAAGLAGCYVYDPYYPYYPYGYGGGTPATYDRAWNAALGAMRDQNLQIVREDRGGGVIDARRGGLTVTARVITQSDGRVRVEFNTSGALAEDPGLPERVSRGYDARMGR